MKPTERVWALVLALLLALPATAGAGMAEPELRRIDVTANAEEAYMLKDNALWWMDDAHEPRVQIWSYEVDVRGVFARDDEMYVAYRDGNAVHFARQADSGALDDLFAVQGEADVYDFVVTGDALAVLWYPKERDAGFDGRYRFSAFSLTGEALDLGQDFAAAIAPCAGGRLLLACDEMDFWYICELDPATGEQQKRAVESGTIRALAGTPEELYLLDDTGINRVNADGTMDTLQMLDGQMPMGMVKADDALICFAMDGDGEEPAVQVRKLWDEASGKRALTVYLDGNVGLMDDRMHRAIQKLQNENPDAHVEFVSLSEDRLNAILTAGGDGADVVLISSGYDQKLMNSGAFLDLNGVPELRQALEPVEYLLPIITNDEGGLCGVPAFAFIDKIYEFRKWKAMEPDDFDIGDCTWMELLEAAMQFGGDANIAFFMDFDTDYPTWLSQYIAAEGDEVSFDTPLFRELAEAYRTALNAGKIQSSFGSDWGNCLYMLDSRDSASLYGDTLLPPPALGSERPARLVTVRAFAVNARGNNQDLAIQLLLNYLDPEVVYADGGYDHMRLDEAQYVDMEQFAEWERALIEENREAYAQAIPGRETYGFLVACQNWMPQYYSGQITLDELIRHLQREWDMRRLG